MGAFCVVFGTQCNEVSVNVGHIATGPVSSEVDQLGRNVATKGGSRESYGPLGREYYRLDRPFRYRGIDYARYPCCDEPTAKMPHERDGLHSPRDEAC